MKCPQCGSDNRRASKFCGECGAALPASAPPAAARTDSPAPSRGMSPPSRPAGPVEPLWTPDWRWHLKVLAVIYAVLVVLYLSLNLVLSRLPEPYRLRDIPPEMTPWLKR